MTKAKIQYADGTSETVDLPTPEQMDADERALIEGLPEAFYTLFGVTKDAVLKSHERTVKPPEDE